MYHRYESRGRHDPRSTRTPGTRPAGGTCDEARLFASALRLPRWLGCWRTGARLAWSFHFGLLLCLANLATAQGQPAGVTPEASTVEVTVSEPSGVPASTEFTASEAEGPRSEPAEPDPASGVSEAGDTSAERGSGSGADSAATEELSDRHEVVSRYPNSEQVYRCAFDAIDDPNFDGWPRDWTRLKGSAFPHYVKMAIARNEVGPDGTAPMRVDLDGGAAAMFSPAIEIEHQSSYVVEVETQASGLRFDEVRCSITWLDAKQNPLGTIESPPATRSEDWQTLRLGPVSSSNSLARFARVGLHVTPVGGQDLRGVIRFDDVWMARLPRIEVFTPRPHNLFTELDQVEVHCRLSGLKQQVSRVRFDLFDVQGTTLATATEDFGRQALITAGDVAPAVEVSRGGTAADWTAIWRPSLPQHGFYRVSVTLGDSEHPVHRRELTLAVVEPQRAAIAGEFGWTLPQGVAPLGPQALAQLLGHAGISWVKLPVWVPEADLPDLTWFVDRLKLTGIETVGLLGNPPAADRERLQLPPHASAADVFTPAPLTTGGPAPQVANDELAVGNWYQTLEPVFVQLALRVRWWQLGDDRDLSFFGYPHLESKVAQIKSALDLTGQDANLGLPWSWILDAPRASKPAWRFLAMSSDPPLTPGELARYLAASAHPQVQRWVSLPAPSRSAATTEQRASDLLRRMVAAKVHGAERVFVPDPFDPERGLLEADGTPAELFLPWRTMALSLAGASYAGSLELPGGSTNHLFLRDEEALLVAWNDTPREELVYLGEQPKRLGLWGGSQPIERREGEHVLSLGPLPTVVVGLQAAVTRLQLALGVEREMMDNVPDVPHRNQLELKSYFQQGASGKLTIHAPDEWRVRPRVLDVNLAAGEAIKRPFDVVLGFDAETGKKPLRLEFDLVADRRYHFSVTRWLKVGSGDVTIELSTRLNEYGDLEVEQRLSNRTDGTVSYNCDLFAPDRRRQRVQIVRQPAGETTKLFRFRDGEELLGQTLRLRAEELGGRHVLNYRIVARP